MKKLLLTILCFVVTLPAFAASPWDGTWKLDRTKSHLTGDSFTYSKLPDGKWRFAVGVLKIDVAPDGKPYPVLDAHHTVTLTMVNDHTIAMVREFKGKTVSTSKQFLSADGNTLSSITTGTAPNGAKYTSSYSSVRTTPGTGFFGTWVSTEARSSTNAIITVSTAPDGLITISFPTSKESVSFKTDDKPAPVTGAQAVAGVTVSFTAPSSHRRNYSLFLHGRKVYMGYQLLSADGKSYQDVSWAPTKTKEKNTSVYIKQ